MKRFIVISLLSVLIAGCKSHTEFGECVGLDSSDRKPDLIYKLSTRNAIWSALGMKLIVPAVLWATDYAYCPVGNR